MSALRIAAAFLLALLLPVQSGAAACAQICAFVTMQHEPAIEAAPHSNPASHDAGAHEPGAGGDAHADHCGTSETGAGKCCQAHNLMAQASVTPTTVSIPAFERRWFVERWTNFIPEEPSPPPIDAGLAA